MSSHTLRSFPIGLGWAGVGAMSGAFSASQYAFFGGGDGGIDGGLGGSSGYDADEGWGPGNEPDEVEITMDDDEALAESVMARLALGGRGAAPMPHQQLSMPHPPVPQHLPFGAPVRT